MKGMCQRVHHLAFLDSAFYLAMLLRKLPEVL
jgi:hypothetical protein